MEQARFILHHHLANSYSVVGFRQEVVWPLLKAVAALRNASKDLYHVSKTCSSGHLRSWQMQMESYGLWPIENVVGKGDVRDLLKLLGTLDVPKPVGTCDCLNFVPDLPEQLQHVVYRALNRQVGRCLDCGERLSAVLLGIRITL